jgi:hypothetical protein
MPWQDGGWAFIRLRQDTLLLVGALRRSRPVGAGLQGALFYNAKNTEELIFSVFSHKEMKIWLLS